MQSLWYAVSIRTVPPAAMVRSLVCEVVQHEKPTNYRLLGISFFVDLDSYVPPVGHGLTDIDRYQNEHWVARYMWNVDLPKKHDRIFLVREHRFVDFDHLKNCKK